MPGRNYALKLHEVHLVGVLYRHGGYSRRQIAARFGVSEQAVRNSLALVGVAMRSKKEAKRLRPGGRARR
jgi:transposase